VAIISAEGPNDRIASIPVPGRVASRFTHVVVMANGGPTGTARTSLRARGLGERNDQRGIERLTAVSSPIP
jgi:hypothetical protein